MDAWLEGTEAYREATETWLEKTEVNSVKLKVKTEACQEKLGAVAERKDWVPRAEFTHELDILHEGAEWETYEETFIATDDRFGDPATGSRVPQST
jgi:hypothetical protein